MGSSQTRPFFSLCCLNGKIKLPAPRPTPELLDFILDPNNRRIAKRFRESIRTYNSMFVFTSMGVEVDHSVNERPGPCLQSKWPLPSSYR
jgi:hypothetical protein